MKPRLLTLLFLFHLCLCSPLISAGPDDSSWLIYDKNYKDYFLLRIDMKTSLTGKAWIAGGNAYAGRRFLGYGSLKVSMLGGGMTILKDGDQVLLVADFNHDRDEIQGRFLDENGNGQGDFFGALQGHTNHRMDLFQICRQADINGVYSSWRDGGKYQCLNRGRDEKCGHGAFQRPATFFSEQNCLDVLQSLIPADERLP